MKVGFGPFFMSEKNIKKSIISLDTLSVILYHTNTFEKSKCSFSSVGRAMDC